jgi:4-hydroxy-2-oxoheptanedioate aldolase
MVDRGTFKKRLQAGEVVLGPFTLVQAPIMMTALGIAGMDFVILDMEHGPFDMTNVEAMCHAADAAGVATIVRVGELNDWMILRALDVGATGVEVPQISCKADAEAVVRAAKYTPIGRRGLSIITRAGALGTRGPRYTDLANEETVVVIHIEGVEGVRNLDEVLTVDNIDVIFLGPYDLSQSLGIPGQVEDPRVEDAIRECVRKIKAAGKCAGSFAKDATIAKRLIDMGVQYMSVSVDAAIYKDACSEIVRQLKG